MGTRSATEPSIGPPLGLFDRVAPDRGHGNLDEGVLLGGVAG
jgi:hypothetical protein